LVCFTLPDYLIELYRENFKNDLSRINGDPSWTVPTPGRYDARPEVSQSAH
jgi:hypothetical protein